MIELQRNLNEFNRNLWECMGILRNSIGIYRNAKEFNGIQWEFVGMQRNSNEFNMNV